MKQTSVMKHAFSQVPSAEIPRSSFDRSHGFKTTFNSGFLIPVYADEVLPGDTFNLRMTGFARLGTPLHPVMDNMYLSSFFFAVPLRLLWENWERFNGEQDNPADSTDFLIPQLVAPGGGYSANSLEDYLGIPVGVAGLTHSSLWHRAYNLIWNDWFRDENLQDSVNVPLDDGPDLPADYELLRRGKRHDYFTSALPFPQKGPSVQLPLGEKAPITGLGVGDPTDFSRLDADILQAGGITTQFANYIRSEGSGADDVLYTEEDTENPGFPNIYADLSQATAATINELRNAFQIQKLYERDARGGSRYTEIIRSHFGVVSPDARLQRPEYLGGGSTVVGITAIANTAGDTQGAVDANVGDLGGVGTSVITGHGFTKSFTEHCVIIGMISVRADLTYQEGLNRMWSRRTRFDFYWPALSHIGEQAVLNKEIWADGSAADEDVFGYQERFAEYRYKPSIISGEFRSSFAQSLDTWHLSQDFQSRPSLSATFIEDTPPISRIIAVLDEPEFLFDSHFALHCARPMPIYGVPGLIDHF